MRAINPANTAIEAGAARKVSESIVVSNDILSFGAWSIQTNANLDTTVPQSYAARDGGTTGYAAFRKTDATCRVQVLTLATAAHWALSGGAQINAATDLIMRPAVFTDAARRLLGVHGGCQWHGRASQAPTD